MAELISVMMETMLLLMVMGMASVSSRPSTCLVEPARSLRRPNGSLVLLRKKSTAI